jgi:hypothetical protein
LSIRKQNQACSPGCRLDDVSAALLLTDSDIIIIGDYKTMGTGALTASTELY